MRAACHYTVSALHPSHHFFQVTLTILQPNPLGQKLWLPNWILGSYMIRDFSRHIISVSAKTTEGLLLSVKKIAKNQWYVSPYEGEIIISYEVYAWDLSVRGAHLDQTHGYFNGSCLFLAVEGQEDNLSTLEIHLPTQHQSWRIATTLESLSSHQAGVYRYQVANYLTLLDHPVEMGDFSEVTFTTHNTPHRVVVTGQHRADLNRLSRDLTRICAAAINFWGEDAPPFNQYLFQVMAVGSGYGGLEHRSSTSLLCSRDDLPLTSEPEHKLGDKYKAFLGLCSHEYFHSWLVKRIQPKVLVSPDLHQENYTELLWVFEGFTSYYDDLLLARASVISTQDYLDLLAQTITRHLRTLGRFQQTVTDSSFDAWTKYYKQDENTLNSVVSYYVKGSLIALCIDLKIRQLTDNQFSLDTVMRQLWQDYGKTGLGIDNDTVQNLVQILVQDDLSAFWQHCLYSTEELPFAELLSAQGVSVNFKYENAKNQPMASLGIRGQMAEGGFQVQNVWRGSAAQAAGISAGDVLIAVDGLKVSAQLEKTVASYAIGDTLSVYLFRRDELRQCQVVLQPSIADFCTLQLSSESERRHRVERWILGQ